MATIGIVGDGPGGLSAALFLARAGHEALVFGDDKTAMHFAMLNNYLGVPGVPGSEFQERATAQATDAGATITRARVEAVGHDGDTFTLTLEDGTAVSADYLILSEGRSPTLAQRLGLAETDDGAISVDQEFRASIPQVYVLGRSIRPRNSQAIISAGAGATAALDILAAETGEPVQDWDSMPKE